VPDTNVTITAIILFRVEIFTSVKATKVNVAFPTDMNVTEVTIDA
jgi:hypothetical protein